jgi:glycosyltransferase involved in cell wall biosynthesis
MSFMSIAIPTYEYHGFGTEVLEFSFDKMLSQTFSDFDVIISDHSKDDEIKNLCEKWKNDLDIKYYRCEEGRGIVAYNLNNAIKHCDGKWIKLLDR